MRAVLYDLAHNPLLLSIGKGTAMNFTGRRDLGATQNNSGYRECSTSHCPNVRWSYNLRLRAMQTSVLALFILIAGRFVIFPLVVVFLARHFGLSELETTIALFFATAPTASSAYTLAQQMGGDTLLMTANITIQKAFALLALPTCVTHFFAFIAMY